MADRINRRSLGDERGAAIVEFSIAVTLLLVLLFGIISYGYVLSFKQGLTQAAAEGARAGAVGSDVTAAVTRSIGAFNKTCSSPGMTCNISTTSCAGHTCQVVTLTYDYDHYPLLPKFPGLGLILPNTLTSTSIAEVN